MLFSSDAGKISVFISIRIIVLSICKVFMLFSIYRQDIVLFSKPHFSLLVELLQLFGLFAGGQCVDQLVQIAVHDLGKIVHGQADAVIGAAVLREVVGADLFAAVAGATCP